MTKVKTEIEKIRQKSKIELKRLLIEKRERLRQLRFDLSAGKIKNFREIRKVRREIARILTFLGDQQAKSNRK